MSKKNRICYLCGKDNADTREHMPPKSFFTKETRSNNYFNLITVPAHKQCNNIFSDSDEKMRNLVVITSGSPAAKNMMKNKVMPSYNRNKKPILDAVKNVSQNFFVDPRKGFPISIEEKLIKQFMVRLTKAMHYHRYEKAIRSDLEFDIIVFPQNNSPDYLTELHSKNIISEKLIKENEILVGTEFKAQYFYVKEDDLEAILCLAHFYQSLAFACSNTINSVVKKYE